MNFYTIFREKEGLLKAKFEKLKEQLTVVLRLFVIMGIRSALRIEIEFFIAGVPWVLDLVATVISHEYSIDKTCYLRASLDILTLLTVRSLISKQINFETPCFIFVRKKYKSFF